MARYFIEAVQLFVDDYTRRHIVKQESSTLDGKNCNGL